MEELSSRDREFVAVGDELRDLINHPAWKTYENAILIPSIDALTQELTEGDNDDPAFLRSARITLRALKAIKDHPYAYVETARAIRRDSGLTESTEGEMNAS